MKDEMESMKYIQLASTKPETLSSNDSEQKKKEDDDDRTPGKLDLTLKNYIWKKTGEILSFQDLQPTKLKTAG